MDRTMGLRVPRFSGLTWWWFCGLGFELFLRGGGEDSSVVCWGSFWGSFRDVQDVPELEVIWNLIFITGTP